MCGEGGMPDPRDMGLSPIACGEGPRGRGPPIGIPGPGGPFTPEIVRKLCHVSLFHIHQTSRFINAIR